jgi:polysaccharide pyruvyl transferase WcaK-like protein
MEKYNGKKRAAIISLAKEFKAEKIDYLDKNSNISERFIINTIANVHLKNGTLRRLFLEKVDKLKV